MEKHFINQCKQKNIVVFTKYFGYNYTGATITTHELINEWKKYFNKITVITRNLGEYDIENITIKKCSDNKEMLREALKLHTDENIFYTDDHTGFLLGTKGIEYHHTYHASWPEARFVNKSYFIKSFGFIPLYKKTIKNAKSVIAVSYYSKNFIKKLNKKVTIIRNGIGLSRIKNKLSNDNLYVNNNDKLKCIMIGNIDSNKYSLAKLLFDKIVNLNINICIDIYGKSLDSNLVKELSRYEFVNIKGFQKDIDLKQYDLMLSTSKFENLSIGVCEAIESHIPVVAFDIGGLSEVVLNGENGFLIETYNVDEMAKIIKFISKEKDIFDFSKNTLELFDWELAGQMYAKEFIVRRI